MKIRYGSSTFAIHPKFAPTVNFIAEEGENEAAFIEEMWDIEGSFKESGWSTLMTKWNDLVATLRVPAQDFAILTDADVVVYELNADDCINGPSAEVVNVTEKRSGYLVTNIRFRISIKAKYENPDAELEDGMIKGKVELSFRFDSLGFLTASERGEAEGALIQQPPKPWLRPTPEVFELDSSFDISESRTKCRYSYTWKERKVGLPVELRDLVSDFSLSISERSERDFLYNTIRVSGRCKIKRNETASEVWDKGKIFVKNPDDYLTRPVADNFIPVEGLDEITWAAVNNVKDWIENSLIGKGVKIVSKDITVDAYDLSISFRFDLLKADIDLARFDYSISLKPSTVNTSTVNVFGSVPVIQRLGFTATQITERGEVVMFGRRPGHPRPYGIGDCTAASVEYPKPEFDSNQDVTFSSMRFSYTYISTNFSFSDVQALAWWRARISGMPTGIF